MRTVQGLMLIAACAALGWAAMSIPQLNAALPPTPRLMVVENCAEGCRVQRLRVLTVAPVELLVGVCVCGDAAGLWAQDR